MSEFLDKHKNKLTILSLNIDSLSSKFDDLSILVNTLAKSNALINIICIQEARIGQGRGDWGPLGHFLDFVKYFDSDKQDACITYHN